MPKHKLPCYCGCTMFFHQEFGFVEIRDHATHSHKAKEYFLDYNRALADCHRLAVSTQQAILGLASTDSQETAVRTCQELVNSLEILVKIVSRGCLFVNDKGMKTFVDATNYIRSLRTGLAVPVSPRDACTGGHTIESQEASTVMQEHSSSSSLLSQVHSRESPSDDAWQKLAALSKAIRASMTAWKLCRFHILMGTFDMRKSLEIYLHRMLRCRPAFGVSPCTFIERIEQTRSLFDKACIDPAPVLKMLRKAQDELTDAEFRIELIESAAKKFDYMWDVFCYWVLQQAEKVYPNGVYRFRFSNGCSKVAVKGLRIENLESPSPRFKVDSTTSTEEPNSVDVARNPGTEITPPKTVLDETYDEDIDDFRCFDLCCDWALA